MYRLVFLPVLI